MGRTFFYGVAGFVLCLTLWSGFTHDSKLTKTDQFWVMLDDKKIGNLSIVEATNDSITGYALVSNVKVTYLLSLKVKEKISERYERRKLVKSTHYRTINGSLKASNHVRMKSACYMVTDSISGETKSIDTPILWSTLSIYFKEPVGVKLLYSQNFRKMMKVTSEGNHVYHVHLPKEKRAKYTYKKGKLVLVETEAIYGTIRFVRKTE